MPRCTRAYGKAGNGNEMETENRNRKLKREMETQPLISWCVVFYFRHNSQDMYRAEPASY